MDPLSTIVSLLRPAAAISKPISAKGRWGVRYDAFDAPGFMIILAGEARLAIDGCEPLRLSRGDFLLLPKTPAFTLSSGEGVSCEPAAPLNEAVRHGEQDGEPDFVALGGSFTFERVNSPLLLVLLPKLIFIPASDGRSTRFRRLIELLSEECTAEHPGKEMVIHRMLEVLLVEALRWQGADRQVPAGFLRGQQDPALARALKAIHADIRANWTVAGLAGVAGMSRSAFSARFSEALGCAPIEYVARWRMAIAKDALAQGAKSLERIADDIGYDSASAFSTAFRRHNGCAPGQFARRLT
ncbi:cupin domain-containing protein [Bosea sp. (in: a-proteobacteria)]|uniref:AraC family transcriptional regulator n=1 Tax=Bosea sp. (in: a-proteobacteria) TaxID=1871050 RepID=UPI003B3AC610